MSPNAAKTYVVALIPSDFTLLLLPACGGSDDPPAPPPPPAPVSVPYTNGVTTTANPVAYWNKIASDTINLPGSATGTPAEQRPVLAVDLATVHVAIYDAINAISGTHKPLLLYETFPSQAAMDLQQKTVLPAFLKEVGASPEGLLAKPNEVEFYRATID